MLRDFTNSRFYFGFEPLVVGSFQVIGCSSSEFICCPWHFILLYEDLPIIISPVIKELIFIMLYMTIYVFKRQNTKLFPSKKMHLLACLILVSTIFTSRGRRKFSEGEKILELFFQKCRGNYFSLYI